MRGSCRIRSSSRLFRVIFAREHVHWSEMSSGEHFAALEQPGPMLAGLRAFVSTVAGNGFYE
jgi:hypothetical protein